MESGSNQTIHVDATSSINNNNQKENLAGRETNSSTSTGGGGASVATGSLLKSGVPLPKPIVPGSIGGKKVGSKSKNNVELHSNSNNNGSSGDAATNGEHHSQHKKKKGSNTNNGRKGSKKNGEAEAEKAGDGSTSGDIFHDALAPEGTQQKAAKPKKKLPPKPKLVKKMKQPNLKAYFKKK